MWIDDMLAWLQQADDPAAELDAILLPRRRELAVLEAVRKAMVAVKASATNGEHLPPKEAQVPSPPAKRNSPETLLKARKQIATLLREQGPTPSEKLRALAGINNATFYDALKSYWFAKEPDGWHLTQDCIAELFDPETTARVEPTREPNR